MGVVNSVEETVIPADYQSITHVALGNPFHHYFIVRSGQKEGLFDGKRQVLPVEFSEISPTATNWSWYLLLKKDGRVGAVLPNSEYPPLLPKYESLMLVTQLPSGLSGDFGVFLVKKGSKYGYVGENGVEYFKN